LVVTPSPDEEDRKLLLPVKFNLARWPSGLAFRTTPLDEPEVEAIVETFSHLGNEDKAALAEQLFRIHWEGPVTDVADEVFAKLSRCQGATAREMEQATDWLRTFLKARPPSRPTSVRGRATRSSGSNAKPAGGENTSSRPGLAAGAARPAPVATAAGGSHYPTTLGHSPDWRTGRQINDSKEAKKQRSSVLCGRNRASLGPSRLRNRPFSP
jgi:hypothetical protein